jgi:hypothetical protein
MFDVGLFAAKELDTHLITVAPPDAALWRQSFETVVEPKIVRHNLRRNNEASASWGNIPHKAGANEVAGQGGNLALPVPCNTCMFAGILCQRRAQKKPDCQG